MNCETLRGSLIEFVDGTLDDGAALECRAHVEGCAACAREVAAHRASWQLLGELPVEPTSDARLRQLAASVLAEARAQPQSTEATPGGEVPEARPILSIRPRRVALRTAVAAAIVIGVFLAGRFVFRLRSAAPSGADEPLPACLADPEFVGDFDVLSDLTSLDDEADGPLLDLDHDEVVMLELMEDV